MKHNSFHNLGKQHDMYFPFILEVFLEIFFLVHSKYFWFTSFPVILLLQIQGIPLVWSWPIHTCTYLYNVHVLVLLSPQINCFKFYLKLTRKFDHTKCKTISIHVASKEFQESRIPCIQLFEDIWGYLSDFDQIHGEWKGGKRVVSVRAPLDVSFS